MLCIQPLYKKNSTRAQHYIWRAFGTPLNFDLVTPRSPPTAHIMASHHQLFLYYCEFCKNGLLPSKKSTQATTCMADRPKKPEQGYTFSNKTFVNKTFVNTVV